MSSVLDIEAYLVDQNPERVHVLRGYSGRQAKMPCPWCGYTEFYVALERHERGSSRRPTYPGDFVCFSGRCEQRGSFPKLYAEMEGISYKEARLALVKFGTHAPLPPPERRKYTRAAEPEGKPAPLTANPEPPKPVYIPAPDDLTEPPSATEVPPYEPLVAEDLPEGFVPVWDGRRWNFPAYLKRRGLTRRICARFGLGFCQLGRYGGRIILPVRCPVGYSFTSRATDPTVEPRYLSGPGAGRLLFGWDQADPGAEVLVVCEGPFDALSIAQAGFAVVAMMGKRFKSEQLDLLNSHQARRIVMMLDGDALADAIRQAPELGQRVLIAGKLSANFKDANEALEKAGPEPIVEAIAAAQHLDLARPRHVIERVAALRARFNGSSR